MGDNKVLLKAVAQGHINVVSWLVQTRCLTAALANGEALEVARRYGRMAMVTWLEQQRSSRGTLE